MEGLLPENVLRREDWAVFGALVHRGLRREERGRLLGVINNSRLVRLNLAEPRQTKRMWNLYLQSERDKDKAPAKQTTSFLFVEEWLRHLERVEGDRLFHLSESGSRLFDDCVAQ